MKRYLVTLATVGALLGPLRPAFAGQEITGSVMDRSAQAVSVSQDFDMSGFNRFSMQAVYADGTPTAKSFSDGAKSTATITVSSAAYVFNSTPTLKINGVTISYTPVATATGSAKAIMTAINANASLNTVIVATNGANTGSVVYATASTTGINAYLIESSSAAALLPSNNTFYGGSASDLSLSADTISEVAHGFSTGLAVLLVTSSGTAPTGLTTGTTYYVIKVTDDKYSLASTANNAAAGTAIDISAESGRAWVSVAPLALSAGSSSAKWQASNDGTNFTDLSVSSVTTTSISAGGNAVWDFATYGYRYLRFKFVGPTSGAVSLGIKIHGKKE
jgi:hypothetical protein